MDRQGDMSVILKASDIEICECDVNSMSGSGNLF